MPVNIESYRNDFNAALDEIHALHMLRYVWKNMLAMFASQPELPADSMVNYYLQTTYSSTLAIGIRRQAEASDSRTTIGSVLRRVNLHAADFTIESCGFNRVEDWATGHGWLNYADTLDQPLSADRVQAQIDELVKDQAVAKQWVNKRIAHRDRQAVEFAWNDLEQALAGLRRATIFLFGLFNQGGYLAQVTPYPSLSWVKAFSQAWYDPTRTTLVEPQTLG
ncbi:AbiU2 domain-containing protein [Jatrophihabitans sp. DSM 45814]